MAGASGDLRRVLDDLESRWLVSQEHERPKGPLYHYTDAQGFSGIFTSRRLRATDYRFLNDRREMVCGEEVVKEAATALTKDSNLPGAYRDLISQFVQRYDEFKLTRMFNPFIVSFSEEGNLLSQWRAYSADGAGFSIGFDNAALPPPTQIGGPFVALLVQCRYGFNWLLAEARAVLVQLAHQYTAAVSPVYKTGDERHLYASFIASALRHVGMLIPRVKDKAFSEEKEYRIIVLPIPERAAEAIEYRVGPHGLVPYIQLQMALSINLLDVGRVYVGPRQDGALGTQVAAGFLKRLGYGDALAEASGIPYRDRHSASM